MWQLQWRIALFLFDPKRRLRFLHVFQDRMRLQVLAGQFPQYHKLYRLGNSCQTRPCSLARCYICQCTIADPWLGLGIQECEFSLDLQFQIPPQVLVLVLVLVLAQVLAPQCRSVFLHQIRFRFHNLPIPVLVEKCLELWVEGLVVLALMS